MRHPFALACLLPVEGFTICNSHSFNLTKEDTTVEQYLNLTYIDPQDRQYQREDLTIFNDILSMGTIPPFTSQQACATFTFPGFALADLVVAHAQVRERFPNLVSTQRLMHGRPGVRGAGPRARGPRLPRRAKPGNDLQR